LPDESEEEGVESRNKNPQHLTPVQFKVHREKERSKDIAESTEEGRYTQFYFTNQMHNINYIHADIKGLSSTCYGTSVPSTGGTMYLV
jgi:hypothetical protein